MLPSGRDPAPGRPGLAPRRLAAGLPLRRMAGGPLPAPLRVTDAAQPDVLRAQLRGSSITLLLNGARVAGFDTRGFHLEGDLGLYVENLDEPRVHVHFDRFTVTPA